MPTIAIQWCNILCIGPTWVIQHHYIGLELLQWYRIPETTPDRSDLCMVSRVTLVLRVSDEQDTSVLIVSHTCQTLPLCPQDMWNV